jgi:hypothetical protein
MVFFPQRKTLQFEFTTAWRKFTVGVHAGNGESKLKKNRAYEIYMVLQSATKELCNGMKIDK